jgi:hypothetical protein
VRLVPRAEAKDPSHPLHPDGGVVANVRVRKKYSHWIRENGELFVNQKGLIGEVYLEVTPPPASEPMGPTIKNGASVRGIDPARMEDIVVYGFQNAQRFRELVEGLRPEVQHLRAELDKLSDFLDDVEPAAGTYRSLSDNLDRLSKSLEELNPPSDSSPSIRQTVKRAQALMPLVDLTRQELSGQVSLLQADFKRISGRIPPDLLPRLSALRKQVSDGIEKFEATRAMLSAIGNAVRSGQGTVGALLNDPEFMDDAKKLGRYLKRHPWELVGRPKD